MHINWPEDYNVPETRRQAMEPIFAQQFTHKERGGGGNGIVKGVAQSVKSEGFGALSYARSTASVLNHSLALS